MQNEVKLAKREAKLSSGANSHVSHHKEGAAWVPSTSATPVVGEPGVVSSRKGGERWQRVRAQADKRRREAEATLAMAQRRKVLIEQLKAEKRRQRKIEMKAKALRQKDGVKKSSALRLETKRLWCRLRRPWLRHRPQPHLRPRTHHPHPTHSMSC